MPDQETDFQWPTKSEISRIIKSVKENNTLYINYDKNDHSIGFFTLLAVYSAAFTIRECVRIIYA